VTLFALNVWQSNWTLKDVLVQPYVVLYSVGVAKNIPEHALGFSESILIVSSIVIHLSVVNYCSAVSEVFVHQLIQPMFHFV
jgi:hypothetical protein